MKDPNSKHSSSFWSVKYVTGVQVYIAMNEKPQKKNGRVVEPRTVSREGFKDQVPSYL